MMVEVMVACLSSGHGIRVPGVHGVRHQRVGRRRGMAGPVPAFDCRVHTRSCHSVESELHLSDSDSCRCIWTVALPRASNRRQASADFFNESMCVGARTIKCSIVLTHRLPVLSGPSTNGGPEAEWSPVAAGPGPSDHHQHAALPAQQMARTRGDDYGRRLGRRPSHDS